MARKQKKKIAHTLCRLLADGKVLCLLLVVGKWDTWPPAVQSSNIWVPIWHYAVCRRTCTTQRVCIFRLQADNERLSGCDVVNMAADVTRLCRVPVDGKPLH